MTEQEFENMLNTFASNLGNISGATDDLVRSLRTQNTQAQVSAQITERMNRLKAQEEARTKSLGAAQDALQRAFGQLANGFGTQTRGVMNATGAYTAVIPTLDLMANTVKSVVEAVGQMVSNISAFGFSTGNVSAGMAKLANTGIDFLVNVLKLNIETAQRVIDQFNSVAKSGATFGGSIDRMRAAAANASIPLSVFTDLIKTNSANLGQMSLGMQRSAAEIARMGTTIKNGNPQLLAMYGSQEDINNAIVEYVDLQRRVGVDALADQAALRTGATAYLQQQKELTALTGKSVEEQKRSQEERRKDAAYQIALNRMGADARLNAEYAIEQIAAKFGPEAAQYAKEYISTGGQVISKAGIIFESMAGPLVNTVQGIAGGLNQSTDAFKQFTASTIQKDARRNADFLTSQNETLAVLVQAGRTSNEVVTQIVGITGNVLSGLASAQKAEQTRKEFLDELQKGIGASSQAALNAYNSLLEQQKKLDTLGTQNIAQLGTFIDALYGLQEKFLSGQQHVSEAVNALVNGDMKAFGTAVKNLADYIAKQFGIETAPAATPAPPPSTTTPSVEGRGGVAPSRPGLPQQPVNPQQSNPAYPVPPTQNVPRRAEGGITAGPVIAGEAGPEAVIPLKQGSVPVALDISPLIQAMDEQVSISRDLLDEMRDAVDVQKRILQATY